MSRPHSKITKEPNLMVQALKAEMDPWEDKDQPEDKEADENEVPDYPMIFWS